MSDCSSDSDDRDPALYPTPAQRSARKNLRSSLQGHRLVPCVYRLIGWMYTSTEMHRDDETWKELNAQTHRILDEVWFLAFAWVTRPKTPADFAAFLVLDCHCSARRRAEPDHATGEYAHKKSGFSMDIHPRWYLFSLFVRVFDVIQCQADDVDNQRMTHIRRRMLWPRTLHALLPHGATDTLRGLLQWFEHDLRPRDLCRVYLAYDALLTFCHPLVLPRMVTSERFLKLAIIKPVRNIEKLLQGLVPADTLFARRGFADSTNALSILAKLILSMTSIIGTRAERAAYNRLAPQRLLNAYEVVVRTCQVITADAAIYDPSLIKSGIVPRCSKHMISRAGEVVLDDPEGVQLKPLSPFHEIVRREVHQQQHRQMDHAHEEAWYNLLHVLVALRNAQCCASPGCRATTVAEQLKACLGCERVLYYSQTYQKRA
jgi:hypothetical protein